MSCHRAKWTLSAFMLLLSGLICVPAAANGAPDCGEGTLLSHPPDLSEFSNNAYVSVRAANAQVYQRFGAVSGTVTGIRWWGITASFPANTNCAIDTPSFKVGFYEDNLAVPGGGIQEFTVTPTITDTGSTLFGFPLRLFEVTLPNSLEIEGPGWLTVFDPSFSQSCRFFWAASETGGGQAVSFNFSQLKWEDLNDDVAFCIVGEPSGDEEGEPEPSLNCYEESLFGQAPDLGPFGTGHFSTRASNRKVHERFTNVNEPVAAVRWWGIATVAPSGNPCDLTGTPLAITFATDNGALPGGGIVTHTVTPTIVDSGQTVAGVPLLIFEAILPEPVTIEGGTGWIDIYDPNIANTCRFGWASSVAGNGQAARFRLDLLQWEDVNDDLAVCLLPEGVILPPEGEEGEGTPEGGVEGEGAVEGEGEPGDLSGCGEDAFVSRPPDYFEITATAFASVRSADRQVYERYDGAPGTVTGIRWWGITTTLPGGSDCTLAPPSFEVGFYQDNLSVPGGGIVEETVTPTITNTGQTLFGVPVKLFEATFSQPIEIPASGWVSVFDTNINQTCLFSWVSSEVGGGQAVAFKQDTLSWLPLNDDVAFCLIGEAGAVEGEGEPDPEIECLEETLFGQTPDLGPFGTGHFSARSANRKLYERFTGVEGPIVALRWWGIASQAPSGTFCNFEGTPLQISFSMEGGAFPGGGIVEYSLTPTMTDTGVEVASLPLYLFEVELPEPVTIEGGAGWVGIYDPNFQNTCRFGWASSIDGNGQSRRFRFDTLTWENVNDDLAICLIGLPAEGEGEGTTEGAVEGEGEGTAEGAVEGEGEGMAEGEGEGVVEGEGEGGTEGEDPPGCVFPLSGAQEVGPVATEATGLGYFTTDIFGELTGIYVEHNVVNPTVSHIHAGAAGVNGGVIIDLGSPVSPIVVTFTPEQVALLRNTPAFYVNVHSSSFSGGEIRGQAEQCLPEQPEGSDARNALNDFNVADTSGDGRLDFSEFSARFGLSGDAFNALDLNGDQRLSIAELQRQLPEGKPVHNADQDGDGSVALTELLRVIQFYNAGRYDCANDPDATEDGFEIPAAKGLSQDCAPHASDYQGGADGVISLSELLRLIQLFNLQSFFACAESEDGFCVVN